MASLITLYEQKAIIHNRHAYRSKNVVVGAAKCYEWSKHWCTWETRLTWQARLPDSAYSKSADGKPDKGKPLAGLAVLQKITFTDTLISIEKECPKVTVIVTEVFPLSGADSELFEDPQEHGWLWAHDCAEKSTAEKLAAPQQCKLVSDVLCDLYFVTATVTKPDGEVVAFGKEHVTNNLNASTVKATYQFDGDSEPTNIPPAKGTLVPTPTPLPDQGEHGKHSFHACVDHCKDWMTLSKAKNHPPDDVPAIEKPPTPRTGPDKKLDRGMLLPPGDPRRLAALVTVGPAIPWNAIVRRRGAEYTHVRGLGRDRPVLYHA